MMLEWAIRLQSQTVCSFREFRW